LKKENAKFQPSNLDAIRPSVFIFAADHVTVVPEEYFNPRMLRANRNCFPIT
jgi:hypothetical protein